MVINRKQSVSIALFVLIVVLLATAYHHCAQSHQYTRGKAVYTITDAQYPLDAEAKKIAVLVKNNYEEYRDNAKRWSGVYFSCIFLGAILSALAGVVLKLEWLVSDEHKKKDVAAILAATGAILMVISTNGNFQNKWMANRMAASQMESLAYDLLKSPFTVQDKEIVINHMREIALSRNREIVGVTASESEKKTNPE